MARRIVLTSGKGGVGKTTVCANLGIALATSGAKVVMLDADIGLNNLDVVMGVESKVTYDILDVLEGKCRLQQALVQDMCCPTLWILPSTHTYGARKIGAGELKVLVERFNGYDYVLIDCPAGIDAGFHRAVSIAGEAYVVVTPCISSKRDADKVITLLTTYGLSDVGVIVNKMRGDLVLSGDMMNLSDISRLLRIIPKGVIPDDDSIALSAGSISVLQNEAKIAFTLLADNIANYKNRLFDCTAMYKGFKGKLKMLRRRI